MTVALRPDQRFVIHLASGGLGHSLHHLGNSLVYADASERAVIPCFEGYPTFAIPFWDVFRPRTDLICSEPEAIDAVREFARAVPGAETATLANLQRLHGPGGMSIPAVGEVPIAGLGPVWIPWAVRRRERFLLCDGLFKHGSGLLGRMEQAWFEARARGSWGLDRALSELQVTDAALDRTRGLRAQIGGPYIAVHFRNTDRRSDLDPYLERTRAACHETGIREVYWATDDARSLQLAQEGLAGLRVRSFARISGTDGRAWGNLHYATDEQLEEVGLSRRDRLHDTLGDIYMLSYANVIVAHPESALSRMAACLRHEPTLREAFMPAEGSTGSG